jgi:hypothetical protein
MSVHTQHFVAKQRNCEGSLNALRPETSILPIPTLDIDSSQ